MQLQNAFATAPFAGPEDPHSGSGACTWTVMASQQFQNQTLIFVTYQTKKAKKRCTLNSQVSTHLLHAGLNVLALSSTPGITHYFPYSILHFPLYRAPTQNQNWRFLFPLSQ